MLNCYGHDRHNPRNIKVPWKQKLVLDCLSKKVRDFFTNPQLIKSLVLNRVFKNNHYIATIRSERREALILVIQSLVMHTELMTMRVGMYKKDGFDPFGEKFLAKKAGLDIRRYQRAIADLKSAGIIDIKQRYESTEDGRYRGLNAIRTLSTHLFSLFGLGDKLKKARAKATNNFNNVVDAFSKLNFAENGLSRNAIQQKIKQGRRKATQTRRTSNPKLQAITDILSNVT